MRELERDTLSTHPRDAPLALTGRGPVGRSLALAAERAKLDVRVAGRDDATEASDGVGAVLLCVPDTAIAEAARALLPDPPPLVGHVSGATTLKALAPATESGAAAFSLHPLQTFPDDETAVEGSPAAIAGTSPEALAYARAFGEALGMRPFEVPEENRAAYHAAASIASNLLVALEESAA